MILNFSLWVHNCIARCEIEIKDEENGPKFLVAFSLPVKDCKAKYAMVLCFQLLGGVVRSWSRISFKNLYRCVCLP